MSVPAVRIAEAADAPALAALRRAWTVEWNPGDGAADHGAADHGAADHGAADHGAADHGAGDAGFEARFLDWYERESARRVTWLAEVAGKPAGMMNLAVFERMPQPGRDPACWGYLSNAFVLAAHRDQGIGSLLLRALLDYADGHGYVRVVLNPSERSVPFYGRFGFGTEHGLLVRHRPELAGLPARAEPPTGAGHSCGQAPV